MFYKRLCDQWEHEADEAIAEQERITGRAFSDAQKAVFRARGEHRFLIPEGSRWGDVLATSIELGRKLTAAMRAVSSANAELRGVFTVDWNAPAPDGSGGMLVHCADYLRETGHNANDARFFGQEMNWGNAAIGKINSVLHGLEAQIAAGASTITDPAFRDAEGKVQRFSLVLANFPFSDDFWWLKPEQQTDDKNKEDQAQAAGLRQGGLQGPLRSLRPRQPVSRTARQQRRLCLHPAHPGLAHGYRACWRGLSPGRAVPRPAGH
jgi:type I restriction-modification system DNA methylase subunit